jgi:hypothetical protein
MKANALAISIRHGGSLEIAPTTLDGAEPSMAPRAIIVPASPHGSRGWIVHVNHRGALERWFAENPLLRGE